MKGYRFFIEFASSAQKRKATVKTIEAGTAEHEGNCLALYLDDNGTPLYYFDGRQAMYDCASSVYFRRNSPVATSGVSETYLRERCKRVPERIARQVHPELIKYLEGE